MTADPQWEPITRAWLLIKVSADSKTELAHQIFDLNNTLIKKYNKEKVHIVRADIVCGPYDLVVPIYTEHLSELEKIKEHIRNLPGVSELDTALVVEHVPFQTWDTKGYLTYQELVDPVQESQFDDMLLADEDSEQPASEELGPEIAGHKPWASLAGDDLDQPEEAPAQEAKGHKPWDIPSGDDLDQSEEKPTQGSKGHKPW